MASSQPESSKGSQARYLVDRVRFSLAAVVMRTGCRALANLVKVWIPVSGCLAVNYSFTRGIVSCTMKNENNGILLQIWNVFLPE
jgi:hypothetical protein